MKTPTKDILLIAVAFIVILGCGFGLGNRFAPKAVELDPSPPSVAVENFEDLTLSNLSAALALTPAQEAAIRAEIKSTSSEIRETRRKALFEYHQLVLQLSDKISPHLDQKQQETLKKNRASLQDVIEKRFPILLDKRAGDGSQSKK